MASMSICADMRPFRERLKEAAKHAGVPYGQTAIARALGVSKQTVDQWMDKGRPTPEMIFRIADAWGVSPRWLAIEDGQMVAKADGSLSAREEMVVLLFRGLTKEQQRELVLETNAAVQGNLEIQKRFLNTPLRTYSNEDVEAAFGRVPPPAERKKVTKPKRRPGFAEEDPE